MKITEMSFEDASAMAKSKREKLVAAAVSSGIPIFEIKLEHPEPSDFSVLPSFK